MNRRLRRTLAVLALATAAVTAPSLANMATPRLDTAWGAEQTANDTAWGLPPADGGTTSPAPAPAPAAPVTGTADDATDGITVPPINPYDTAWG